MHCSYAPQPSHAGSRRETFFNATLVELQNWLYDLPDDLRLDVSGHANTFPQAYTLHMTFYTAVILLANGTLVSNVRTTLLGSDRTDSLDKKASCVCYEAATNMCNVAKNYRKTFGDFHLSAVSATHCLLSAALVLIQVASNEPENSRKKAAAANVDLCLQCLDELSVSWRIAGKTHRNLALLKERKLGSQASTKDVNPYVSTTASVSDTDHANNPSLLDLTNPAKFDVTNPVHLNDTHSFLEPYTSNSGTTGGFDFAAQLADIDFHDPSIWGSFGLDFTTGPEI